MTRQEIYKEMEEIFGIVPTFIKSTPDNYLEEEWNLVKNLQLSETHIPHKYKELIGLGLSAATHCQFCTLFHAEGARLYGATDEEIEEAVHLAKLSTGWSTYLHGMQVDYEQFKDELHKMVEHAKAHMEKRAA